MSSPLAWLRDELGIEVDADAVGARFQSPVRVGVGDGVGIGIEGVTEIGLGVLWGGCRCGCSCAK